MSDFAQNFIAGFMAGHRAKSDRERLALEKEGQEEEAKRHKERLGFEKQRLDLETQASDLKNKLTYLALARESPALRTPVNTEVSGSRDEDLIGTGVETPEDPLEINIGGQTFKIPVQHREDVMRDKLLQLTQEAKVKDDLENVPLTGDIPQLGLKAGTRIRPNELTARVALHGDEAQVQAARERSAATRQVAEGAAQDAGYLGQQIVDRRIDFRSLTKDQKTAATSWLSEQGLDVPRQLTAKEKDAGNSAISGLGALDRMDALLSKDPQLAYKDSINFDGIAGAPARALVPNLSEYSAAKREAVDVVTRIRTGAALNKEEERFYPRQVAQSGDSPETVKAKHNQLRAFYLGVAGIPVRLTSPDGKQQVTYQDLYDPKQRVGTRKRIAQGWRLEY